MANEAGVAGRFDPICGRKIASEMEAQSTRFKKRQYFFCSEGCKVAFERRAEKFRLNELAKMGSLFSPGRVRWGMA